MTSSSGSSRGDSFRSRDEPLQQAERPSADELRTELVAALQGVLPAAVAHGGQVRVSDMQWIAAISPFCTTARQIRLPIESAIVTVKQAWHLVPIVAQIPADERDVLLGRLVTLCIETYFAFPGIASER